MATSTGLNTLSTKTYRDKYRKATLETALRNMLISEKIFEVDRSDSKTIQNPYQTAATTAISTLTGTYAIYDYAITDDTLTVEYEFKSSEHIYDFESTLSKFDLFASRLDDMVYSISASVDQYVLNTVLAAANTSTYTTPAGGFTTAANLNVIMANLISKVAGYADVYKGLFLVVENTDLAGIVQAQATNGFSYADAALNNGFVTSYMGVDIYVVRTGTFTNTDLGGTTENLSGHRMFGVKNVATFAFPRGVQFEEKAVSGKTGKEVVAYGYIGAKLWTPKVPLIVDITIA